MELSARTDIGNKRAENQDSYRAQAHRRQAWLAVCDGMAARAAGGWQSGLAGAALNRCCAPGCPVWKQTNRPAPLLEQAVRSANEAGGGKALATPAARGMGTTVVCGVCRGGMLQYAHVGDSHLSVPGLHRRAQLTRGQFHRAGAGGAGPSPQRGGAFSPAHQNLITALWAWARRQRWILANSAFPGDILCCARMGWSNYVTVDEMEEIIQNTGFYNGGRPCELCA